MNACTSTTLPFEEHMNASARPNTPEIDTQEILDGIRSWVEIESPSTDAAAVNVLVGKVSEDLAALFASRPSGSSDSLIDLGLKAVAQWLGSLAG